MEQWLISLIQTVAFPIVACIGCGYYVKYTGDKNREERKQTNLEHKEEVDKLADVIQSNTIAITKMCEKLDDISSGKE